MPKSPTNKRSIVQKLLKGSTRAPRRSNSNPSPPANSSEPSNDERIAEFLDSVVDLEYTRGQFNELDRRQNAREMQTGTNYSYRDGQIADPLGLNRYTDILPYDHSRVRLIPTNKSLRQSADYINASEVYTPGKTRRYIATQGPRDNTISDFWRMVWDNVSPSQPDTVSTIIMLTQVKEGQRHKCSRYWPDSIGAGYQVPYRTPDNEDISLVVRLVSQENKEEADAVISTLELFTESRGISSSPSYTIKHMLYKGWKDMDVPESNETFLNYFRLYRQLHASSAAPIVHCSAGCGRTGVFIALDYLFTVVPTLSQKEILADPVFETVDNMRTWRGNMVFRPEQLHYIYELFREIVRGKVQVRDILA